MKFSVEYVVSHFGKAIIIIVVALLIWIFWPRGTKQVNRPTDFDIALPGSTCVTDQRSVQVQAAQKPWEVGAGVGAGRFGDKDAYGGFAFVKFKF